jgi:hypothetical protein
MKEIGRRTHPAKKASRSLGSSPATCGRWQFSSNEMTPNRPVHTMSRRWMSTSGIPGGRQERIGLNAVPAAWASAVSAFAGHQPFGGGGDDDPR